MAAAVVVTPSEVQVGDQVAIAATGFVPNGVLTLEIPEYGEKTQIQLDASGAASSDDIADKAVATLTSDGTNVTAADTVTIGAVTYTFRAAVSTTANEVKIGADAAGTLANLKAAINLDPAGAANYGSLTVVHPTVGAGALTATTLQLYAKTGGTAGNSLTSTEASTHLSFGGATFAGGAAATGISSLVFTPTDDRPFTVKASDGTTTVNTRVMVFTH